MRARLILAVAVLFPVFTLGAPPAKTVLPATPIRLADFIHDGEQGSTLVQDPDAPVSFELSPEWILRGGVRWGNHETTLTILDGVSGITATIYYQYPNQAAVPTDLDAALVAGMENKVRQRQQGGLKDYHIRAGSGQTSVVDGRPALSFVGDFTGLRGQAVNEYNLRVIGANTKAEFFVQLPVAADLQSFTQRLIAIAETLRMP
jgi:hypothetical protein